MSPLPSGVNEGHAIVFGCGGPGAGVLPEEEAPPMSTASPELGLLKPGPMADVSTLPFALTEWHTMQPLRTISGVVTPGLIRKMPPPVAVASLNGKSGDL